MRIKLDYNGDWSTIYTDGDPTRTSTAARYITEAYPDEPLFCIRGRDRLAIPTAEFYLRLAYNEPQIKRPVIDAILEDLGVFEAWQYSRPEMLKYPDRKG